MIASLRIENFALIDSIQIDFKSGFTVITGETGSGKSILLNALNLILGERANFSVIGNRSDKSTVEAVLEIQGFGLNDFFTMHELDYFDQTIVRREINKQGRSRAFINDTPVQLSVLKALTSQLIHIHSQYNTLELKDVNYQLKVLDVLAEGLAQREEFNGLITVYHAKERELERLKKQFSEAMAQSDYNNFQLNELESLNLSSTNYEEIQSNVVKGENADEIRKGFADVLSTMQAEGGVIDALSQLKASLGKKVSFDPTIADLYNRISSSLIELNDIEDAASAELEKVEFDPRELDQLLAKLDVYNRILLKHSVNSQADLVELMNEFSEGSFSNSKTEEDIKRLERELMNEKNVLLEKANALHEIRSKAIPSIEERIKTALAELKLENTELVFKLSKEEKLGVYGNSGLEILFSPNVGVAPVPVHEAASGGELSRVMLALQSLMSAKIKLRTVLFDEIDTGVSGDVAQKMGNTLKKMGGEMQVIAITHLPQVAAKGGQHFKVLKEVVNEKTTTFVQELSEEERVEETARLMSGDIINQSALENAKALMQ